LDLQVGAGTLATVVVVAGFVLIVRVVACSGGGLCGGGLRARCAIRGEVAVAVIAGLGVASEGRPIGVWLKGAASAEADGEEGEEGGGSG
jgi:hypothetical protein